MEDEETLETGARVDELPDPVENQVDDLLPDGVVASSVVVGGVLLAGDQLLGVEQLPVGAGPHLEQRIDSLTKTLVLTSSTTVGSRSTKTALGTCFPAPVSEKNVLKESSPAPMAFDKNSKYQA